ncbi:MAG: CoA-transferase family protein 8 [Rhizobacter sp.]|nr:CoA-transferase family protein 8 [Rhizobacter sp.]
MDKLPLAGLRVTDFCWLGAGAYATKILADLGADVIKIENADRLDSLRMAAPYKDKKPGVNRSGYFADRNTSKRSITLDMKHPRALALIQKLIRQSDIVANNFTPGVMGKFGLGYDAVKAVKPDVIYLAMSMQGAEGPERDYLGYGASMVSLTGLQHLTGLPDREAAGPGTNYPDHIPNPCHAAFALLAAVRHRRRTGQGQFIDLAQIEPTIALLGPTLLDLTVNGRHHERQGNRHDSAAPHGVYRCAGNDRWIAIAAMNDAQWASLVRGLGSPAWALEPRWSTGTGRYRDQVELDRLLDQQTSTWVAEDLMATLQAAGVPAGVVQTSEDVMTRDPQLAARGHWVRLNHAEMGETVYNAPPFRFSKTPADLRRAAPLLGEHTREVCAELLELDDAEIDELVAQHVLR